MEPERQIFVNGQTYNLDVDPETPLIFILRNDLGFKSVKYGCGSEQCGACKVLIDGRAVPTCKLPVKNVIGMEIITLEGLGTADSPHPMQEAFIEEQAMQCGFCTSGMITTAQGLLNDNRYPSDDEIREGMAENLCRCGVHDRIKRAIKLRTGRPSDSPIFQILEARQDIQSKKVPVAEIGLSSSFQRNPNLDSWIHINTDGTVTVYTGKVEYGQGIKTAFAQIAAEELEVDIFRIRIAPIDTDDSPDEGMTVSSMSLETSGLAIRTAAAEARHFLLRVAFEELEASLDNLFINDGTITDSISGRSTTYWELFGGQQFNCRVSGKIALKNPETHIIIGKSHKRLDLLEKATGAPVFIQDLELPEMLHARVIRPPHYASQLVSVDTDTANQMPGVVRVIKDGTYLAVVAEREEQSVNTMEYLRTDASWEGELDFPPEEEIYDHLLCEPAMSFLVVDGMSNTDPIPPVTVPDEAEKTISAEYLRPYQMHASLGPASAAALLNEGKMTIWVHSQGVYPIRSSIAHILGMDEKDIRVIQKEGSGCYGHNGADDAALDAALDAAYIARYVEGRSVLLKLNRSDDFVWEPFGPAMVMKLQASLDENNKVIDWSHDVWSYPHLRRSTPRDGESNLIASWHVEESYGFSRGEPIHASHFGAHRNAEPFYNFPLKRIVKHFVQNSPLRTSALRGLGAYGNLFAIESFMDELAVACGTDPIRFRLHHVTDERAVSVIEAAAEKSQWEIKSNRVKTKEGWAFGRGFAYSQYKNRQCHLAVVVNLWVDLKSGAIQLDKAFIVADAGLIINPDGLSNQLEGGFIFSASMTLKERVGFDSSGITTTDWDRYPILRFPEAPEIEVILINRVDKPTLGSGEASQGPTAAAIANAVFDAVGIRLREIPFTPERVLQALEA